MKNGLILFSLISLVFLAGCLGFQPTEEVPGVATGVIIKSFGPDISEIYSEDSVIFTLSVENVGEEEATNVQAKLFGLGTDWSWTTGKQTIGDGILSKSVPEEELPGGVGDYQWEAISPSGLKVDNTYTVGVRVYYSYNTTALGSIKVYNYDYIKAKPEEAEEITKSPGIASFSVTKAPITVSLAGAARPLILRKEGQSASITILIKNIGQGHQYNTQENDREVTINKIKVADTDCTEKITDTTPRLPIAGEKSVSCSFTLPEVDEFTTIPVEVELSYNYFVDGSSTIKVLKAI